ncbi:MAG: hypothetical protein ACLP1X_33915 [Polyangiaceae bacterium]
MRRARGITVAAFASAAVIATPQVTVAAPVTTGTGAAAAFASLPEGQVPPVPAATPPKYIAPAEKVAGFVLAGMPADQLEQLKRAGRGVRFTYLFSGEDQAKTFARSRGGQGDLTDACMVDGGDTASQGNGAGGDTEPRDWPTSYSSMLSFQFETDPASDPPPRTMHHAKRAPSGRADVHVVHAERFVAGRDGRASLDMADAWIDVRTRGARLIGRSTLPLARVFVGPNGFEVYAAHSGDALEVVLHAPDRPSEDAALAMQLRTQLRSIAVLLPDRNGGNADCGHLRFTLRASPGVGQMATTIQAVAFLPPLDSVDGDAAIPPENESDEARGSRELQAMRQRPYRLSVSATATSTDETPFMSVGLGWVGRERTGS